MKPCLQPVFSVEAGSLGSCVFILNDLIYIYIYITFSLPCFFLHLHLHLSHSAVILSFAFVSHAEAQYPSQYEQKSERRRGLSHTIVSTSVICVLLSAVVKHRHHLSGPPILVICLQSPHHNKNTILFMAAALFPLCVYSRVAATIRATCSDCKCRNQQNKYWKCDHFLNWL